MVSGRVVSPFSLAPPHAEAIPYLDDFEAFTRSSPCTTMTSPCTTDQMGIPTLNVVSGRRQTQVTNAATLSVGSGVLDYDASDESSDFFTNRAFASPTDFNASGNSLIFDVSWASNLGNQLEVVVTDNDSSSDPVVFTLVVGPNEVLFSSFSSNTDFTKVKDVTFGLSNDAAHLRLESGQVPEPSTASMMLLGLLRLASAGRPRKTAA
jgi:hypothetical protein